MPIFLCDYTDSQDIFTFQYAVNRPENGKVLVYEPEQHLKYEICFVLNGTIHHEIDGEKFIVNKNDMILIDFNEAHTLKIDLDSGYERMILQFTKDILPMSNNELNLFFPFNRRKFGYNTIIPEDLLIKTNCREIMENIYKYAREKDPYFDTLIKSLIIQLLYTINDICKSDSPTKEPVSVNMTVKKAINYILDNIDKEFTLDELSKKLLIGKYYLCHTFKKHVGLSVGQYVSKQKIIKAAHLIESGISPVQASKMLNFQNYSSFYKAFKKYMGQSPKKLKKS